MQFLNEYFRHINMCSNGSDELYTVALKRGFICLLTLSGASLDILSTRPFSCVLLEEATRSSITSLGISPDKSVVFAVDQGLKKILRMELVTGNCRSLEVFNCNYKMFLLCYILFNLAEVVGLSFLKDSVLLHHGLKTLALTSMGMVITTIKRMVNCVKTASSFKYLLTAGYYKISHNYCTNSLISVQME